LWEKGFGWLYLRTDALSGIPDKEQIQSSDAEPICYRVCTYRDV